MVNKCILRQHLDNRVIKMSGIFLFTGQLCPKRNRKTATNIYYIHVYTPFPSKVKEGVPFGHTERETMDKRR